MNKIIKVSELKEGDKKHIVSALGQTMPQTDEQFRCEMENKLSEEVRRILNNEKNNQSQKLPLFEPEKTEDNSWLK